jgi:peptidyl-prolyl cis-trans isomerase C
LTAIIVVVVAAAAGGAGYYFGSQGAAGKASTSGAPTPAAMTASAPTGGANTPVVAKVDGAPIYQSEVDAFIADLGDRARQVPPADLQTQIVDRLIDMKLAGDKAHAEKLEQDPAVARRLYNGQETTLAEAYLEKAAQAQINDDVLKAKYDDLVKQAKPAEEVRARHILVKTEAEAKDIIKQLDKGADFEKLAKDKSTDPGSGSSGGDLGYFTKDKMVPEFADAAFKLDKGKYTETPVHSQYGWHIIQVLDKRSQPLPAFDAVKPQLNNLVLRDQERKVVEDLRKGAKIERFNADGSPITDTPPAPATPPAAPATPPATPAAPPPAAADAPPAPPPAPKK